jgi:predicted phosphate transport protein (TIGR00153 family)
MSLLFKNAKQLVIDIDEFISTVEQGVLLFREGVTNYLTGETALFNDKINNINRLEAVADKLLRKIDNEFYKHSLLPQSVNDIAGMLAIMDDLIDISKDNLYQFEVEVPFFPDDNTFSGDYIRLAETSSEAALNVIPAVRTFFREPLKVRDMLAKVYFYEREADKLSRNIKRKLFHKMPELTLAQKIHLRYFALHIETISDKAEVLADELSILALKMSI